MSTVGTGPPPDRISAGASGLNGYVHAAADLYQRDLASGYTTVLCEMIAGSLAEPDLRQDMLTRLEPWLDLAAEFINRALEGLPIGGLVQPAPLASGLAALYLGMEVMTHLDGDRSRFDPLFDFGRLLAEVATSMRSALPEDAQRRANP